MSITMRTRVLALVVAVSASAIAGAAGQARPNPSTVRKTPGPSTFPVAIDTDLACSLSIDGENQGELPANGSKTFELLPGEHVLRAVSKDDPSIVWRQIVDVAGQRKAVLIELAAPLERKRAVEAEKARADQQMRADSERKAAEAERARLDLERLAEQKRRDQAAEDLRAAEADRVRREAERIEADKAAAVDAARARADDEKRFSTALLLNGWKQSLAFHVSATTEGGRPVLRISGPEARAGLAMVNRQDKPAFRFDVQRARGRECPGLLFVSRTNIAYDPTPADCKQESFDIARTNIQKLKVVGESPTIEFEGAGEDRRFVFLAEEIVVSKGGPRKGGAMPMSQFMARKSDPGLRASAGATGIAMREWFKAVMLDFDAAQKAFARQTADQKPTAR